MSTAIKKDEIVQAISKRITIGEIAELVAKRALEIIKEKESKKTKVWVSGVQGNLYFCALWVCGNKRIARNKILKYCKENWDGEISSTPLPKKDIVKQYFNRVTEEVYFLYEVPICGYPGAKAAVTVK